MMGHTTASLGHSIRLSHAQQLFTCSSWAWVLPALPRTSSLCMPERSAARSSTKGKRPCMSIVTAGMNCSGSSMNATQHSALCWMLLRRLPNSGTWPVADAETTNIRRSSAADLVIVVPMYHLSGPGGASRAGVAPLARHVLIDLPLPLQQLLRLAGDSAQAASGVVVRGALRQGPLQRAQQCGVLVELLAAGDTCLQSGTGHPKHRQSTDMYAVMNWYGSGDLRAEVQRARTSSCRLSDSSMKDAEPSRCSDALPSVLSMLTVRPICRCSPPPHASR